MANDVGRKRDRHDDGENDARESRECFMVCTMMEGGERVIHLV